jgi:hypothetical protein
MKSGKYISILGLCMLLLGFTACKPPAPKETRQLRVKNNFIVLLDLSDRIIVQPNQLHRDKEIIHHIYDLFEKNVKENLYIKSRDEIKVVIAPQRGANLPTEIFEDRLYVNMDNINIVYRKSKEEERRIEYLANVDTLYEKAIFSTNPEDYYGADIWKYFYEDLRYDYVSDSLTKNYLFILTDGYPIVGKNPNKLQPVNYKFHDLHVVLIEAAPREKDMEWDRIMEQWGEWFEEINIPEYTIIKRKAISKEKEMIEEIVFGDQEKNKNMAQEVEVTAER